MNKTLLWAIIILAIIIAVVAATRISPPFAFHFGTL